MFFNWCVNRGVSNMAIILGWGDFKEYGDNLQIFESTLSPLLKFPSCEHFPVMCYGLTVSGPKMSQNMLILHELKHANGLEHPFSDEFFTLQSL